MAKRNNLPLWAGRGDYLGLFASTGLGFRKALIDRARRFDSLDGERMIYENSRREDQAMIDSTMGRALDRLKWPSYYVDNTLQLRQEARADWRGYGPFMKAFAGRLIKTLADYGVPMFVTEAYRDKETQDRYFREGKSQRQFPDAAHCQLAAFDLVHSRYAWDMTKDEWAAIGKIGLDVADMMNAQLPKEYRRDVAWGGRWRSPYDPAHWEIHGWEFYPQLSIDKLESLALEQPQRHTHKVLADHLPPMLR